ncbi:hypothetical protein AAVH_01443 [Aphelenchoides avenae]|nr:hypothetical protein AAVH_01443 [Aphelenchus avenae]
MVRFETDINDPFHDTKDYRCNSDVDSVDREALQQVNDTIKYIEKALASLEKAKSVQRLKPKYCVRSLTQYLDYLKSYASTVKERSADDRLSCRDRRARTKPFSGTCALQSSGARRQRRVDLRRRQAIERSARTVDRMEWWIRKSDRSQRRAYDDVMRPTHPLRN